MPILESPQDIAEAVRRIARTLPQPLGIGIHSASVKQERTYLSHALAMFLKERGNGVVTMNGKDRPITASARYVIYDRGVITREPTSELIEAWSRDVEEATGLRPDINIYVYAPQIALPVDLEEAVRVFDIVYRNSSARMKR